jgi:hypothetical protein
MSSSVTDENITRAIGSVGSCCGATNYIIMAFINKIKLVIRALLPLIIIGISWCITWLYNLIVYGGYEKMIKDGVIDDSSIIATHLFMGIFYFILLPFIYVIHGLSCMLNNRFNFINIRLGIIVGLFFYVALNIFVWSTNTERDIENLIGSVFDVFLPTLLYYYMLIVTKKKPAGELINIATTTIKSQP